MTKPNQKSEEEQTFTQTGATKIGLHSVKNLLGGERQLSLFKGESVDEFSKKYGLKLENAIDKYGVNLNETQMCIMEGILKGFTQTGYQGNVPPLDKIELAKEKYQSQNLPPPTNT